MSSLMFRQVTRAVYPAALVFAFHLLLRGHNEPGGGFIAGLVLSITVVLEMLAFGPESARRRYRTILRPATAIGLGIALISGLVPIAWGAPPFSFGHTTIELPGGHEAHLAATLIFDVGVVLVIIGSIGTALVVMIGLKRSGVLQ